MCSVFWYRYWHWHTVIEKRHHPKLGTGYIYGYVTVTVLNKLLKLLLHNSRSVP